MKNKLLVTIGLAAILASGCKSVYTGVITITQVRDSAMRELASLHKQNLIDTQTDHRIAEADLKYRAAAKVAESALTASKVSGDQSQYLLALQLVRTAVSDLINILRPIAAQSKVETLENNLAKASKL